MSDCNSRPPACDPVAASLLEDERWLSDQVEQLLAFASRREPALAAPLRRILDQANHHLPARLPFWLMRALSPKPLDAIARVAALSHLFEAVTLADSTDRAAHYLLFAGVQWSRDPWVRVVEDQIARSRAERALSSRADRDPARLFAATVQERADHWTRSMRARVSDVMELAVRGAAQVLELPEAQENTLAAAVVQWSVGNEMFADLARLEERCSLDNWVVLELLCDLSDEERLYASTLHGTPAFERWVHEHAGLPAARARTRTRADRLTHTGKCRLLEATDGRSADYLGRLLGR